jgi:hypothetical protein
MAGTTRYVSPSGSDSNDGLSWATAKATLAGIDSVDTAGDIICLDSSATHTVSGSSLSWAGTTASPTKLVSADATINTPTAKAGAIISASGLAMAGQGLHIEGITVNATGYLSFGGGGYLKIKNSSINAPSSTSSSPLVIGAAATRTGHTEFENVNINISASSSYYPAFNMYGGVFIMRGGSVSGGGAYGFFSINGVGASIYLDGVDMSGIKSSCVANVTSYANHGVFRNCKLPASWSGAIVALDGVTIGSEFDAYETDSTGYPAAYRRFSISYFGSTNSTTAMYRQGGASNGNAPFSWKAGAQNMVECAFPYRLPETALYNSTTGTPITLTMEILCSAAPLNSQLWMEAVYPGDANSSFDTLASSAPASFLDTRVTLTDSTATWVNAPNGYVAKKISLTITPNRAGFILARLALAANLTIYADPLVQVA